MRARFLGLPIDLLDMDATLTEIELLLGDGDVHQHVALNAAKVVQAQVDPELRAAIERCDIVNADGIGVVWGGRILGISIPERVTGIDLMDRLLDRATSRGWPVYFLGARQEIIDRAVSILRQRYPGLVVAGYRNGYWHVDEEASVVRAIAEAKPQLLFVAMPSPRKEQFLAQHKALLGVPFVMGVGGSLDVIAGKTHRAPVWMQAAGLEWLYRFLQEPFRLARRYVLGNARFIALVARQWWAQRKVWKMANE